MYGHGWDGDKVVDRLVRAFRTLPNTPSYSPAVHKLELAADGAAAPSTQREYDRSPAKLGSFCQKA
jgi:hypothetical protein